MPILVSSLVLAGKKQVIVHFFVSTEKNPYCVLLIMCDVTHEQCIKAFKLTDNNCFVFCKCFLSGFSVA